MCREHDRRHTLSQMISGQKIAWGLRQVQICHLDLVSRDLQEHRLIGALRSILFFPKPRDSALIHTYRLPVFSLSDGSSREDG